MTKQELAKAIEGALNDTQIYITADGEAEGEIVKVIYDVDTKMIEVGSDIKLKLVSRDKPLKSIRSDYRYGRRHMIIRRCPVCANHLRRISRYCDLCGQAIEEEDDA